MWPDTVTISGIGQAISLIRTDGASEWRATGHRVFVLRVFFFVFLPSFHFSIILVCRYIVRSTILVVRHAPASTTRFLCRQGLIELWMQCRALPYDVASDDNSSTYTSGRLPMYGCVNWTWTTTFTHKLHRKLKRPRSQPELLAYVFFRTLHAHDIRCGVEQVGACVAVYWIEVHA